MPDPHRPDDDNDDLSDVELARNAPGAGMMIDPEDSWISP